MRSSFSSSSFDYNFNEQKFCPFDGYRFNENEMECNICGCAKTIFKVSIKFSHFHFHKH